MKQKEEIKSLRTVDVPEEEERRIEEQSIRAWQNKIKTNIKK